MAADKKKIAGDCWKKANEALGKQNWDYAINMFRQAVRMIPDNLLYRQTLRGATEKKYGNNGTGARMAGAKLMGIRGKIKKSRMTKSWEAVDSLAEDGLMVNPWDMQLNVDLGDACSAQAAVARDIGNLDSATGFEQIALEAYNRALKASPENQPLLRSMAKVYEERRDYRAAISCWEKLAKLNPLDPEARSKVSQLSAESTINHANFDEAQSTRDVMSDHEVARRLKTGQEADGPGMSVEADMLRAIRKDPQNKDHYLKLADHYMRGGKPDAAEEQLKEALKLSNGDANIREKLEDVQLNRLRKQLQEAKELAKTDPASKKKAMKLNAELVKQEIAVMAPRVERYPSDMRLKVELGKRLMLMQRWKEAIPLFQRSTSDQRVREEALVRLGLCFEEDHKPQLARTQYELALPTLDHESNPTMYRETLYRLAVICEAASEIGEAVKHYSKLLSVDYGYKDAVKRLEDLQGGSR